MSDRLVVFADRHIGFAAPLARAALEAAARRSDVEVAALVDVTRPSHAAVRGTLRRLGGRVLRRLDDRRSSRIPGAGESLRRMARRFGVPLLIPPAHDVNHPELRRRLVDELGATVALSVGCLQIFRAPLLAAFDMAVNYHDGALPAYRGLGATSWSVYRGEPQSGFTFHRMTEGIDCGPIVLEGAVPVLPRQRGRDVLREKTRAALEAVPQVLALVRARHAGRPQPPGGEYFDRHARQSAMAIPDPSAVDWADLESRVMAFGCVTIALAGAWWDVTSFDRVEADRGSRLSFVTRDGVRAAPVGFGLLPGWLYRLLRPLAGPREPAAVRRHPI